jgi:hypothetical protein
MAADLTRDVEVRRADLLDRVIGWLQFVESKNMGIVVLGQRAIIDIPTAAIALASLGVLWRFKLPEPLLVVAAGAIGLVVWAVVH